MVVGRRYCIPVGFAHALALAVLERIARKTPCEELSDVSDLSCPRRFDLIGLFMFWAAGEAPSFRRHHTFHFHALFISQSFVTHAISVPQRNVLFFE